MVGAGGYKNELDTAPLLRGPQTGPLTPAAGVCSLCLSRVSQ